MSNDAMRSGTPAPSPGQADDRHALLVEIGAKLDKFSQRDLAALKDNEDLIQQIVDKYGIPRNAARHEAALLLNGRTL